MKMLLPQQLQLKQEGVMSGANDKVIQATKAKLGMNVQVVPINKPDDSQPVPGQSYVHPDASAKNKGFKTDHPENDGSPAVNQTKVKKPDTESAKLRYSKGPIEPQMGIVPLSRVPVDSVKVL